MRLTIRAEIKFSVEERRVIEHAMEPGSCVTAAQIEDEVNRQTFYNKASRMRLQIMNGMYLRHMKALKALLTEMRDALLRDFHAWSEAADLKQKRVPLAIDSNEAMRVLADARAQQSEKCKEALQIVEAAVVKLQHAEQEGQRIEDASSLKPWDRHYMRGGIQ